MQRLVATETVSKDHCCDNKEFSRINSVICQKYQNSHGNKMPSSDESPVDMKVQQSEKEIRMTTKEAVNPRLFSHVMKNATRSWSLPNGMSEAYLPKVTLSDFSSENVSCELEESSSSKSGEVQTLFESLPQTSAPSSNEMDDESCDLYVTLEDVARYKIIQKRKGSHASIMSTTSSAKLNDDAWSYTNTSLATTADLAELNPDFAPEGEEEAGSKVGMMNKYHHGPGTR